ncbi:MAG TPA: histidine kinase [Mycobacteriales bacterium]|nr:histidine kinase [Mycobacteriales bacterium]
MTETSSRTAPRSRPAELQPMNERFRDLTPTIAPQLARAIVIAVLTAYVVIAAANMILTGGTWLDVGAAVLYGSALVAIHLNIVLQPRDQLEPRVRYGALIAEAALVYLPILHLSVSWIGLPGFLGGSLLLLLRPAASIPLASGVLVIAGTYSWSVFHDAYSALYTVVATTLTGLVIYGLTRLFQLVDQVHAAQDTFAQLAVAEERARFSRDVHDLLGLSLSAIMLKTELVTKLVDDEPERARTELDEVMQITRKALAEARQVATGYRELTLAEECDSAVSVLTTANVDVSLVREHRTFPRSVRSTLATVLREGVTNVLRHSDAAWCTITLSSHDGLAELEVVNDGVLSPRAARATNGAGSGLPNLTERVRALGGNLTSTIEKSCRHRLRVTIPLDQPDA